MDDITIGCSLPPRVDGEIAGDVLLYIPQLESVGGFTLPTETHVRCRWWGEKRPGSLFRPLYVRNEIIPKDPSNTVVYPIVVEHSELDSYFKDMVRCYY